MSLITRCPACGTLFKVVADQLKISQGWVRCGQCAEVFDAQGHMAIGVAGPSVPGSMQAQPGFNPADTTATDKTALINGATDPDAQAMAAVGLGALDSGSLSESKNTRNQTLLDQKGTAEDAGAASPEAVDRHPGFADSDWYNTVNPPAPQPRPDFADIEPPSSLSPNPSADALAMPGPVPLGEPGLPADGLPSFVLQAQRAQRWRSPWVRVAMLLMGVVLLAALAAQVAMHERDRIASREPRALPWLKELCVVVGCTVGPLKQIESLVVDASSFNKLRAEGKFEVYKLGLNLRNTSTTAVAVPHIELSLNDAQDLPVLRRVLSPADLGSTQSVLPPAAELAGNSTLQVDTGQLAGARIAGYRVWAFYP